MSIFMINDSYFEKLNVFNKNNVNCVQWRGKQWSFCEEALGHKATNSRLE